ncbi:hypothetical protein KAU11_09700 [Candidatus Babeliales bacterium]|nr:hypothetical protein [Candidatus Babeliales bacterium]
MSKRKTDKENDKHFASDRFFFADGKWYYYVRSYEGELKPIGRFNSKSEAEVHCNERFSNKIDYFFYKGDNK